MSALHVAGGPALDIVGVGHYDPYLAAYLGGPNAKAFAEQSLAVISRLNDALRASYAAAGIPMADVAAAFYMDDSDPSALPNGQAVPLDVARTCALTWACVTGPLGHNKHPNADGYQLIGIAIADDMTDR